MTPVQQFEQEYQAVHGMSAGRRVQQLRVLHAFEEFAGKPVVECSGNDFRSFVAKLVADGYHVNTVRKWMGMIRPFFGWAFDTGLISGDTLMSVQRVSPPRGATSQGLPRPYSRKELRLFWQQLDKAWPLDDGKFLKRWRDGRSRFLRISSHAMRLQIEAIVRLALDCGLRRAELYAVSLDDISPDNAYVIVRQRGERSNGKDQFREVPYTDAARAAVKRWLDMRTELRPGHDSPWLSLAPNQPGCVHLKAMRWERFSAILGTIPGNWTLHRFRHTCGTEWLRTGKVTLEQVSELLGHATLQQTLGYAKIVKEDIHKAVESAQEDFERAVNGKE